MSWLTKPSERRKMAPEPPWDSGKSHVRKVAGKKNRNEKAAMAAGAENRCRAAEERKTVMTAAAEKRKAATTAATKQKRSRGKESANGSGH
jgi:hypothetical protein